MADEERKKEEPISPKVVRVLPYRHEEGAAEVEYWTDAFCAPGNHLAGRLYIRYVPSTLLLDLKTLAPYLRQYGEVRMLHEDRVSRILQDLVKCCKPQSMTVETDFPASADLGVRVKAHFTKARV